MPTDYQRLGTGRKYGDLVFSPGDDTKPPLLTVAIGPKPEPRKETIPVRRVIDPQTKDEALRLLQAGISVADVAQETGIAVATLYHYKSDLKNGSLTAPTPTPVAAEAQAEPPTEETKPDAPPPKLAGDELAARFDRMERALTARGEEPAEPMAAPTFRIILDPESAHKALAEAARDWIQAHLTTVFDGQTATVQLPPLPTRWVVQAQAVSMEPEEETDG